MLINKRFIIIILGLNIITKEKELKTRYSWESLKYFIFPEKVVFAIALVLAAAVVLQYAAWYILPPEGKIFTGTYNEAESGILAGIRSVSEGFINYFHLPNEPTSSYFISDIIGYGPVYLSILIGFLSILLLKNVMATYIATKAVFTFLLVLSSYYLFGLLAKDRKEHTIAFYLFVVSAGFGGLLYLLRSLPYGGPVPDTFFGFGVGLLRVAGFYLVVPLTFSFLSIALAVRGRIYLSAIFAGIATVFYPSHGIISFLIIALYLFLHSKKIEIIKVGVIVAVFSSVWLLPYFMNRYDFNNYISLNVQNSVLFMPSVLFGLGPALLFVLYHFRLVVKTRRGLVFSILTVLAAVGTSLAFFKDAGIVDPKFAHYFSSLVNFSAQNYLALQIPFIVMMLATGVFIYLNRKRHEPLYLFVLLWLVLMLFVVFAPREITRIFPDKMIYFIYIPVMLIAAKGLITFSEKYKISVKRVLLAVLIISLPGIFFTFSYQQMQPRVVPELSESAFYTHDEYAVLKFLEKQEMGTVIAPQRLAINVPLLSGKSVLNAERGSAATTYNYEEKVKDRDIFYSSAADAEKLSIIKKYGLNYVIDDIGIFEGSVIMEKIYEIGQIKLYKIS